VIISIDDGISTNKKLNKVLSVLKKNNVRGYFFLLGDFAKKHPTWMKKIEDAGHVLGNHSYDHPDFSAIKKASPKKHPDAWKPIVTDQIERGVQGNTQIKLLRPPYGGGAFDKDIQKLAKSLGYGMVYWTVDTWDWNKHATKSVADILRRVSVGQKGVTGPIRKGGVILLHGTSKYGVASLQGIINIVRKKGLKLMKLHE
jgi:peptidoglycan/xylan/chitin deacetylase (PgdA/CDA1 family)